MASRGLVVNNTHYTTCKRRRERVEVEGELEEERHKSRQVRGADAGDRVPALRAKSSPSAGGRRRASRWSTYEVKPAVPVDRRANVGGKTDATF